LRADVGLGTAEYAVKQLGSVVQGGQAIASVQLIEQQGMLQPVSVFLILAF